MVARTLERTDDPDAAEFVVNVCAFNTRLGSLDSWTSISAGKSKARRLSQAVLDRLKLIWSSAAIGKKVRRESFGTWLCGVNRNQSAEIATLCDDADFGYQAIQWRVKMGDLQAATLLIKEAKQHSFWWRLAHFIWCPVIENAVSEALREWEQSERSSAVDFEIGDLLCNLSKSDAESVLKRNIAALKRSPSLISVALLLDSPGLRDAVSKAIDGTTWNRRNSPLGLVRNALMHFGDRLTRSHFVALEPYLDRMETQWLTSIKHIAEGVGMLVWAEKNIAPRIPPDEARWFGRSGFLTELEEISNGKRQRHPAGVCYRCLRGGYTPGQLLDLVYDWLASHPDERSFRVAIEFLGYLGGRKDIHRFSDAFPALATTPTMDRILKNVSFRIQRATLAPTADERECPSPF